MQDIVKSIFYYYFCCMNLHDNIKAIREEKNLKQIEVANHIGVDKSAYSKIEKGMRALTIDELQKMAQLFNMTTDQILNHDGKIPQNVVIEDKTASEQVRLMAQLNEKDKSTVMNIIDTMLTRQKFQTFFEQNIQTANK